MLACGRIKRKREAHAVKENAKARGSRYKVGDLVLVKACNLSNATDNLTAKFLTLYEGPYIIEEQRGPSTFLLTNPNTGEKRGVFHATNFRPYLQNVDEESEKAGAQATTKGDQPYQPSDNQPGDGAQGKGEAEGGRVEGSFTGTSLERRTSVPDPTG